TPGPSGVPWAVGVGIAGASVITFAYCAKIVLSAFVDGRDHDAPARTGTTTVMGADGSASLSDPTGAIIRAEDAHRADRVMLGAAAAPIVVGLPLAFVPGVFDTLVGRAIEAARGVAADPHLAF